MMKTLFVGLLLCICILGATGPTLAQADRDTGDAPLSRLQKEGWVIVQDGVLQRQSKPGEVETFVYGVEGLTWKLQDLRAQLRKLRVELAANPTPELRRAVASHRKVIASTRKMIERARLAEIGAKWDIWDGGCNLGFAYDADASHKVDVRGTWAAAVADFQAFSETCSDGEVYAYAFAKTTVNGAPTTATVTDGPRTGADVNASADASRNGGAPCESYSYSSVTSSSLSPSSYSKSTLSETCPAASTPTTLQVSITPDEDPSIVVMEEQCETSTWTVSISGGTPPYTVNVYRNGVFQRTGPSYSEQFCFDQAREENYEEFQDVTIRFDVTDSGAQSKSVSGGIGISYHWWIY